MRIDVFGSSLVSCWWNGAATYYRGILRHLAALGHRIRFHEPDALDRQRHRDMADPSWAEVVVWPARDRTDALRAVDAARGADLVVKASGVGVFDELLEEAVLAHASPRTRVVYWDVDAPATLERLAEHPEDPLRTLVPRFDLVLTYGGGPRVVAGYERFGARRCVPIYNAHDPETHHPVAPDARFRARLALLANRLPDREARVHEFFFGPAARAPEHPLLLGGSGWDAGHVPELPNVRRLGHVPSRDHNAFNCTPDLVLNVNRASMARFGHSPATRIFEAAGAGACIVSDAWEGLEDFFEPGREILTARDGGEVLEHLRRVRVSERARLGAAARRRALADHTYAHRARDVDRVLREEEPAAWKSATAS